MLAEGGSAVDAMIAVSLCLGVTRMTSSGIGGGGFMNYYKRYHILLYLIDSTILCVFTNSLRCG